MQDRGIATCSIFKFASINSSESVSLLLPGRTKAGQDCKGVGDLGSLQGVR